MVLKRGLTSNEDSLCSHIFDQETWLAVSLSWLTLLHNNNSSIARIGRRTHSGNPFVSFLPMPI